MNDTVNLSLPSKPEYVSVARLTASFVANKMGFDIEAVEDIKLAVGEACNNAVIHSGSHDTYNLEFIQNQETLIIEIKDFGSGFDFAEYHEPKLDDLQENGLGLFIIKSLMDDVEIDSEKGSGTKIKMCKTLE